MDDERDNGGDNLVPPIPDDLDPEEALRAFMETEPEKVKERVDNKDSEEGSVG